MTGENIIKRVVKCEKCFCYGSPDNEKASNKCWKCGGRLIRDYSDKALMDNAEAYAHVWGGDKK